MQNQLEPSARYAWPSHCCSSCCSCTEGRGCLGNGQEPFAPGETRPSAFSDDRVIDQISDTRSQGCTDLQSLIMCLGLWCYSMQVLRQYTAVPATAHDAFACAGCVLRWSVQRPAILLVCQASCEWQGMQMSLQNGCLVLLMQALLWLLFCILCRRRGVLLMPFWPQAPQLSCILYTCRFIFHGRYWDQVLSERRWKYYGHNANSQGYRSQGPVH